MYINDPLKEFSFMMIPKNIHNFIIPPKIFILLNPTPHPNIEIENVDPQRWAYVYAKVSEYPLPWG